jgi:hypothetical protein
MQRHFGIVSSSVAGSDSGGQQFERTEQWILEAEALVEDESENEIPESIQPAPVAEKDPIYGEIAFLLKELEKELETSPNTKIGLGKDETAELEPPSSGVENDSTSKGKSNRRQRVVPRHEATERHLGQPKLPESNSAKTQLLPLEQDKSLSGFGSNNNENMRMYGAELLVMAVTPATFAEHTGPGIAAFDADPRQNPAAPRHYTVHATAFWSDIVGMIAGDIGHDPELVRLWVMLERMPDKTILPAFPILKGRRDISPDEVKDVRGVSALRVWVELASGFDQYDQAILPGYHGRALVAKDGHYLSLLFLKWYNEKIGKFQNFGHIYVTVNWNATLADLKSTIQMHMSRAPGEVLIDGNIAILREHGRTCESLELKSPVKLHLRRQVEIICVKLLDHKFGVAN